MLHSRFDKFGNGTPKVSSVLNSKTNITFGFEDDDFDGMDGQTRTRNRGVSFIQNESEALIEQEAIQEKLNKEARVLRIWHRDDPSLPPEQQPPLSELSSFKSCKCSGITTSKDIRTYVSKRLNIKAISKEENFKLYAILENSKRVLLDDELPMTILTQNNEVKFAYLMGTEVVAKGGEDPKMVLASLFKPNEFHQKGRIRETIKVSKESVISHRNLINYQQYSAYSNVTFICGGERIYSFRCFIDSRVPELINTETIIKKIKEKKSSI
eukprot:TRINITY_DN2435_c0_g1_i1.p1 TRINITY_DN2435_c0_g1~~TRINITY_DN2435_c0_g1_i1.p1  ORF type:complete len:269 (-),score=67.49 TRINITY_DN2435_c0_g1_i1:552-1358(-)